MRSIIWKRGMGAIGLLLAGMTMAAVLPPLPATAEARVAVAANFTAAAQEIAGAFSAAGGGRIRLSFGSTGQLYGQIAQGAPFDVFLAADAARPARALAEGLAVPGSGFTYAAGCTRNYRLFIFESLHFHYFPHCFGIWLNPFPYLYLQPML